MTTIDPRAGRIAAFYAAFGAAWILFSDRLLAAWVPDAALYVEFGQWKGLAFVLGSAAVIYAASAERPRPAAPHASGETPAILFVFALLAATVVLVGLAGVLQIAHDTRERHVRQLQSIAELRAGQLASWLDERRADARALRGDDTLLEPLERWRAGDDAARAKLVRRLEALRAAHGLFGVALADGHGEPLLGVGEAARTPSLPALARRALEQRDVAESDLYRDGAGRPRLDFVAALAPPNGSGAVLLVLQAAPEPLLRPLETWPGPSGSAETVLFRSAGGSIELLSGLRHPHGDAPKLPLAALFDDAGIAEGDDYRGVRTIAVASAVTGTGWRVLAKVDRAEVYGKVGRQAAWIVVADVLALVVGGGIVLLLHQRRVLRHAQRERAEQGEKLRALRWLHAVTEQSRDVIFVKDRDGRYLLANGEMCRVLGRRPDEVVGQQAASLFAAADAARMAREDADVLVGRTISTEHGFETVDGPRTYLLTKGPLHDADGATIGVFGVARDISERKRAEEALRQSAMVFEHTHDGVVVTDAQTRIQAVNRAFTAITGYAESETLGQTPRLLQSGRQGRDFYRTMWHALAADGVWQGEIWNRRKSGEVYPEWLTISAVRDADGSTTHYVGVFTDLSRIKRSEAELERLAHYDPLTGLPNRCLLQLRLEHAIDRAQRHGEWLAVLSIDIDGFKTVNDSLGHHAGDELLVDVAARLKRRVRDEDTLGRFGGDKFLLLLEAIDEPDSAAVVARDLLGVLAAPMKLSGSREALVTASIGISVFPSDGTTAGELLRDADAAMNRAKNQGRNQFCFYTGDMNAEALVKLELEAALSRALERDELLLHYQPKIDARSGAIVGVEALLRWQHDGVLVPPGQFIPVAEMSSLILDIGTWVVDAACRQIRGWLDAGLAVVPVAVNVSARQFVADDLDLVLSDALRRHRVPPALLEVEITESMLMEQPDNAVKRLGKLKTLGVKVSLDDFGTGYSSLAYLQRFPIDAVKIDRSFVNGIGGQPDGATIVDAIIGLAHRMNVRVVAEGVETAAQNDYLLRQGCDELQGYHHSRPLPAEAMRTLLGRSAACP